MLHLLFVCKNSEVSGMNDPGQFLLMNDSGRFMLMDDSGQFLLEGVPHLVLIVRFNWFFFHF